ncbi:MAG: acyl-CoA dehydratase activase-related protein [Halothermotrichaceae bacterium]
MKIGIPRSIFYYQYSGHFIKFFNLLGIETVISPVTNDSIFKYGKDNMIDELCLPLKVLAGHTVYLKEMGISKIFLPVIIGNKSQDSFLCFNQIRSYDIIRNSGISPKNSILTGTFYYQNNELMEGGFYEIGEKLGYSWNKVEQALTRLKELSEYKNEGQIYENKSNLTIGLAGRSYVVEDKWINNNLKQTLRKMGCRMITEKSYNFNRVEKAAHFTQTGKVIKTITRMNEDDKINGIIYLIPFNCGPDCSIELTVKNQVLSKPFIKLVIDEAQGQAGLITRVEAFLDIIQLKRKESASCSSVLLKTDI